MKKFEILMGILFVLVLAVPAMGKPGDTNTPPETVTVNKTLDVDVDLVFSVEDNTSVNLTKNKTIDVVEGIGKLKLVGIGVGVGLKTDKAAEASAIVKGVNDNASGCEDCTKKDSIIEESITGNTGMVNTNQATGHINNQGNVVSIAVDDGENNTAKGFAEAQASVEQVNVNSGTVTEDSKINATIAGSINNNTGMVNFNQSSGNINNQHNVVAIAGAKVPGVALAEADLGQVNTMVSSHDVDVPRVATITGSLNSNTGMINVNQNVGTLNNQANVVSIAGGW